MLHHVTLEVTPEGADRFAVLLETIGYAEVDPPTGLDVCFRWFELAGTQVHLQPTASPTVPRRGHAAFVVADLETALGRLETAGFDVEERARHWGERRVIVHGPDGHRVELMAAPPRPTPAQSPAG